MRGECAPDDRYSFVSHHAVTRYVQRILCVSLAPEEQHGLSPAALAERHCLAAGTTHAAVAQTIATSIAVVTARRMGVSQVGTRAFGAHLRNGIVTTITEPIRRRHGGFKSEPSRRELQRGLRRVARCRQAGQEFGGADDAEGPPR